MRNSNESYRYCQDENSCREENCIINKDKRKKFIQELKSLYYHDDYKEDNENGEGYLVDFFDAFSFSESCAADLMFELMDCGSLYEMVKRGGCRDEKVLFCITRQCLLGIEKLHEQNKIHHDIKPVNILLNSYGEVKIADFVFSRSLSEYIDDDTINTNRVSTFVGTTQYMSPERIRGDHYDKKSDIWSVGITIAATAIGCCPTPQGYFCAFIEIQAKQRNTICYTK